MGILRVIALPAAIAATTICFSSSSPFAFPTKLPRSVPSALATRCLRFAALNMDSSAVEFKTNFIQVSFLNHRLRFSASPSLLMLTCVIGSNPWDFVLQKDMIFPELLVRYTFVPLITVIFFSLLCALPYI